MALGLSHGFRRTVSIDAITGQLVATDFSVYTAINKAIASLSFVKRF
ncbi:MAG: hypothetical protein MRZ79_17060 [Bacteroidia bacterium]|nr:hypothetical protein [Bacteroidia bacterium]